MYKGLEIKYIATLRGKAGKKAGTEPRAVHGVGTFLVAGIWLLWKTRSKGVKELFLESEIGADRFTDQPAFSPAALMNMCSNNQEDIYSRLLWI